MPDAGRRCPSHWPASRRPQEVQEEGEEEGLDEEEAHEVQEEGEASSGLRLVAD